MPTPEHDKWMLDTFGVDLRGQEAAPQRAVRGAVSSLRSARDDLLAGKRAMVATLGAAGGRQREIWSGAVRSAERDATAGNKRHARLRATQDLLKGGSDVLRAGWGADKVAAVQGARGLDAAEGQLGENIRQGYDRALPDMASAMGHVAGARAGATTLRAGRTAKLTVQAGAEYAHELQNTIVPGVAQLGSGMVDLGVSGVRLAADAPYRDGVAKALGRARATLATKWQAGVQQIERDPVASAHIVRTGTVNLLDRTKAAARKGWDHEVDEALAAQRAGHLPRFEAHLVGKAFVTAVGFVKSGAVKAGRVAANSARVEQGGSKVAQVERAAASPGEAVAAERALPGTTRLRRVAVGVRGADAAAARTGRGGALRAAEDDARRVEGKESPGSTPPDPEETQAPTPPSGSSTPPPPDKPPHRPTATSPGDEGPPPEDMPQHADPGRPALPPERPMINLTQQNEDLAILKQLDPANAGQAAARVRKLAVAKRTRAFNALARQASEAQLSELFHALDPANKQALADAIAARTDTLTKLPFVGRLADNATASITPRGGFMGRDRIKVQASPEADAAARVLGSLGNRAADQGFGYFQKTVPGKGKPLDAVMRAAVAPTPFAGPIGGGKAVLHNSLTLIHDVLSDSPATVPGNAPGERVAKLLKAAASGKDASIKQGVMQSATSLLGELPKPKPGQISAGAPQSITREIAQGLTNLLKSDPETIIQGLQSSDPGGRSLAAYFEAALRTGDAKELGELTQELSQRLAASRAAAIARRSGAAPAGAGVAGALQSSGPGRAETLGYLAGALRRGIKQAGDDADKQVTKVLKGLAPDQYDPQLTAESANVAEAIAPLVALMRHAGGQGKKDMQPIEDLLLAVHDPLGSPQGVPPVQTFVRAYKSVADQTRK